MQKDNNKNEKEQANNNAESQKPKQESILFSKEEVRDIVKGFVVAYTFGQIKVYFPSADEMMAGWKKQGIRGDFSTAKQQELAIKNEFSEWIANCHKGPIEEQQKIIDAIFSWLLHARSGNRIEGDFACDSFSKRLSKVEQGYSTLNNLVRELVSEVREIKQDVALLGNTVLGT